MNWKRFTLIGFVLTTIGISLPSAAQRLGSNFDEEEWVEQQAKLPAFPKPEDLIPAPVDATKSFRFLIDGSSIDIGQDGVVRYVLVARSTSGSENISFEGVRCETHEYKLYAVGRADKTWVQPRNVAWTRYSRVPPNYHAELAILYFCPGEIKAHDPAEVINYLKRGGYQPPPFTNPS